MKFSAAGDIIVQQRIPQDYEGYAELAPFICQGDGRFFNLETTLNREGEACASQFSGGTYLRTNPEVLEDAKGFGINMTSFNTITPWTSSIPAFCPHWTPSAKAALSTAAPAGILPRHRLPGIWIPKTAG